jgi:hypothetical protein
MSKPEGARLLPTSLFSVIHSVLVLMIIIAIARWSKRAKLEFDVFDDPTLLSFGHV